MIMMLGHDGQNGRVVGGEWRNVLFLIYMFAQQKLLEYFVGQAQYSAD